MIKILDKTHDNIIALQAEGKIVKDDYETIIPVLDEMVKKHEKINGYLEVKELDGITVTAIWEELKADVKYFDNFKKIAVVGDATWKEKLTKAVDILPGIETRFFEFNEKGDAQRWVESHK